MSESTAPSAPPELTLADLARLQSQLDAAKTKLSQIVLTPAQMVAQVKQEIGAYLDNQAHPAFASSQATAALLARNISVLAAAMESLVAPAASSSSASTSTPAAA